MIKLFCVAFVLVQLCTIETVVAAQQKRAGEVIKPDLDNRDFRIVHLNNGLTALVVSDKETEKAAASLSVRAGQMLDPENVLGLAHFLEHMLFLGTKKYPDESDYDNWLNTHGGRSNAYTANEETNYMFDVSADYLEGSLDRFSQFFISPLFSPSATNREMNAVASEHSKNLFNDGRRNNQLLRSTSNVDHPFHKFGTGNLTTLRDIPEREGINVRDTLLQFHSQYYSANIMTAAVYGKDSLDQLESWVRKYFEPIPNKNAEIPVPSAKPFEEIHLKKTFHVVPVRDDNALYLFFPMESLHPLYRSQPSSYLGYLFGHEGHGSIASLLKKKGWISSLNAGSWVETSDFSVFAVTMSLTTAGLDHVNEIITHVFQYAQLVRESLSEDWRIEEVQQLSANNFRFRDKMGPFEFVRELTHNMHIYPPTEVLSGPFLFLEQNKPMMERLLNNFTPSNLRVHVVSQKFDEIADKNEHWYGTPYHEAPFSAEQLQMWKNTTKEPSLSLPSPNPFIPTSFHLKQNSTASKDPQLVAETKEASVWHLLDVSFERPTANWNIQMFTPVAYESPESYLMAVLFVRLFMDSLSEDLYPARLAGLQYGMNVNNLGLQVTVNGFDEKQPLLFQILFERLQNFSDSTFVTQRFASFKDELDKDIDNSKYDLPYSIVIDYLADVITTPRWQREDLLAALPSLSVEKLEAFIPRILHRLKLLVFSHGNVLGSDAMQSVLNISSVLKFNPLSDSEVPSTRVTSLPKGHSLFYRRSASNEAEQNAAVCVYYQFGETNTRQKVLTQLMGSIIGEPFFTQLRTQEQLGYLVSARPLFMSVVDGAQFLVQSNVQGAPYLEQRIDSFVRNNWNKLLQEMTTSEWEQFVQSLRNEKEKKDKTLNERTNRFWSFILDRNYNWKQVEDEVKELLKLKKSDLVEFSHKFLNANSTKTSRLSVQIFSGGDTIPPLSSGIDIVNLTNLKKELPLYPAYKNPYPDREDSIPPEPSTTCEPTHAPTEPDWLIDKEEGNTFLVVIVILQAAVIVAAAVGAFAWLWHSKRKSAQDWIRLQEINSELQ